MNVFAEVLVILALVLGLTFMYMLGWPPKSANPSMTWLQSALAAVAVFLDASILALMLGWDIPYILAIVILLSEVVVFAWRIWRLVAVRTARHREGDYAD